MGTGPFVDNILETWTVRRHGQLVDKLAKSPEIVIDHKLEINLLFVDQLSHQFFKVIGGRRVVQIRIKSALSTKCPNDIYS